MFGKPFGRGGRGEEVMEKGKDAKQALFATDNKKARAEAARRKIKKGSRK